MPGGHPIAPPTAATGPCGALRTLTATINDPDDDIESLRWRVDGVMMAPGTAAIPINTTHKRPWRRWCCKVGVTTASPRRDPRAHSRRRPV